MIEKDFMRFLSRLDIDSLGCWLWTGYITPAGYGTFTCQGKTTRAHRTAYEHWKQSIPRGLEIDHIAKIFADLANDFKWPLKFEASMTQTISNLKVDMARLALMVVESKQGASESALEGSLSFVLEINGINPDHYANVKERVKEAKG